MGASDVVGVDAGNQTNWQLWPYLRPEVTSRGFSSQVGVRDQ